MRVGRYLISFFAGALIVLTMLVAGLMLFSTHKPTPVGQENTFRIEYLTPEQASALLGDGATVQADRPDRRAETPDVPAPDVEPLSDAN